MPLTLPNLDDRRWTDLVEEGRSLLPLYAPGWTDHNLHDPGVTLLDLFAWVAEMDLYRINRVPDSHRRKFLALVGFAPRPPAGARVALGVRLADGGGGPLELPAGVELEARTPGGEPVSYLTEEGLTAVPGTLGAVQSGGPDGLRDLTAAWLRGEAIAPLGDDPAPGSALYLGLSAAPPAGTPWSLYFEIEGGDGEARRRIVERGREAESCRPAEPCCCEGDDGCRCDGDEPSLEPPAGEPAEPPPPPPPLVHHSARLAWEMSTADGGWRTLDAAAGEVADHTRSLSLSGRVTLRLPAPPAAVRLGEVAEALPYLRCRLGAGALDAAPRATALLLNGVTARQEVPVSSAWVLAPGSTVVGPDPVAGETARLDGKRDAEGRITTLFTEAAGAPAWRVLEYLAATADLPGRLVVETVELGTGTGLPLQELDLPLPLPAGDDVVLASREPGGEDGGWRRWQVRADLDASRRADAHAVVEPGDTPAAPYRVRFGDGERGRVLPRGARLLAAWRATHGTAGSTEPGAFTGLADSPRNRALLGDAAAAADRIEEIASPLPATGASDGEDLTDAARRAREAAGSTQRAVSATDHERLALATPGVRLARAEGRPELHPALPCYAAPGVVTVLVLPYLPAGRPVPSAGLLTAVRGYLDRRRVLGSRIEVAGPTWIEVRVRTTVLACPGVDRAALTGRLDAALDAFFDPLGGGPDGSGWPFGRTVFAAEVYQALDETAGVDGVLALELIGADGVPRCDNLCLPPDGLVAAGAHEITVEGGGASPC